MTLVLTGPGSILQARLRRYRREHGNLPSTDEARFVMSPDVWAEYRAVIVERVGGADEFRRLRKKRTDKRLRYAGYPVEQIDSLPPGTVEFLD